MGKTALFVRRTPGGVFTVENQDITTGESIFVHSGTGTDAAGYGSNPDSPVATLAYANGLCTASKADRVYVMPGHAEDVIAAGTITLNKIGAQVIGLGTGALRPTFTFKTIATATIAVSAASVLLKNVILDFTGVDEIATGVNWTGADGTIEDCLLVQADAGGQAVRAVTIGAAAHRLKFLRNKVLAPNAGATHAIYHAGGATDVEISDNVFNGDFSTACIHNDTALMSRLDVLRNVFNCTGAAGTGLVVHANTTGNVIGNHCFVTANIAAGGWCTAAAMFKSANYDAENAHIDGSSQISPAAGGYA